MSRLIGQEGRSAATIGQKVREAPMIAIREMLPDRQILEACQACGHRFRERKFGPVVTVLHFVTQAIQREKSLAATWQELFTPLVADFPELTLAEADLSGLTHARTRLPKGVMQRLAHQACEQTRTAAAEGWKGFRLVALDTATVSMPDEMGLHEYYGQPGSRGSPARYPVGTLASLLDVGTALLRDWRFGSYDPGELSTSLPLLESIGLGDLLLADRRFSGASFLARVRARQAEFLMRIHQGLKVKNLPVLRRLGNDDFITELSVNAKDRGADANVPSKLRARIFRATWKAPNGQKVTEWFVTSLEDPEWFKKRALARLYHERWRIETSYLEFKQLFHSAVLRSKTVANVEKELAAHVLAYQLVRRVILAAAKKHQKHPNQISLVNATRWVIHFSHRMSAAPARRLPALFARLLDAVATCKVDVRPGRREPRMISRDPKRYPMRRIARAVWRTQQTKEAA